jgi:glycosyltransferase involved in cell wall biosynthesis
MILGIDASQANRKVRSGTEWYAFNLIQEFKKLLAGRKDVQVRLYVRGPLEKDLAEGLPKNFSAQGGPASGWEVKILRWPLRYFWGQLRLSWEMLLHPPDVLFCPAHTIPLIHPQKTLTTLHDIGFEDYPELYDSLSRWYHHFAAKLAARSAAHMFTVSEFSKKRIAEVFGYPEDRITVTHLGFDKNRFKVSDSQELTSALVKYGLLAREYLLFVGRLEPKKNILGIIKGYEQSQIQQPLVLAGRIVRISDVEQYLTDKPDLKSRIKFLGYVPELDKAALYSGARIFLFPTFYEGFGLPIIEAQACGTTVITSNTASNPEIAGRGSLIVDPGSEWEISKAIKSLWSDEAIRKEKIEAGFENIRRFDWSETAKKTVDVILNS